MEMNEVLNKLPRHLLSLVIEQPYNEYTSRDHAVWRYVMRQNVQFLSKVAHGSYIEGLKKTGISIDSIPHMYGMNRILKEIGWAAVAVDGFIPPSAFMEFQAYNVLVIAADIRPVDQIEYTPAPDIIHEAAGHAPIIADDEYAQYLKFFGEIGSKAFSSARDYELYEAVRHLSILKADPHTSKEDIEEAEHNLNEISSSMGEPSEMARIRNLHWWTVEYGLIGSLEAPKIYGAGLLSSIGESYNCLQPHVKKLPYTVEAASYDFDITTQQPHLFVTPDFKHLSDVLNEFADTMALRIGGRKSVEIAENSKNTGTVVLDSGVQITGTFNDSIFDGDKVIYLRTNSPSALAFNNKEIEGHGKSYHKDGYSTVLGLLEDHETPLHEMTREELNQIGIIEGKRISLKFKSQIMVDGNIESIMTRDHKNILITFVDCTVNLNDKLLFDPLWGKYDMVLGTKVVSAFSGPADPHSFELSFKAPAETTHKIQHSDSDNKLYEYYQKVRDIREGNRTDELTTLWNNIQREYSKEWLIMLEILELSVSTGNNFSLNKIITGYLENLAETDKAIRKLIKDGLALVNTPLLAELDAS